MKIINNKRSLNNLLNQRKLKIIKLKKFLLLKVYYQVNINNILQNMKKQTNQHC